MPANDVPGPAGQTNDGEFLRQEYFYLQQTIERFDEKALTIKTWSVTLGMAGIGAAYTNKLPALLWLSAMASLLFWVIEALWKTFQQAHYPRISEIEAMRATLPPAPIVTPKINGSWMTHWDAGWRNRNLVRLMGWPHVFLPHSLVFVGGWAAWLWNLQWPFLGP